MERKEPSDRENIGRDWFGTIYFGFFALLCLYAYFTGDEAIAAYTASPFIFTIFVSVSLYFILLLFSLLNFASMAAVRKGWAGVNEILGSFTILGIILGFSIFFVLVAIPDKAGYDALLSPVSLVFLALSLAHVYFAAKPRRKGENFLKRWLKSAADRGAGLGLTGLSLGFVLSILMIFCLSPFIFAWPLVTMYFLVFMAIAKKEPDALSNVYNGSILKKTLADSGTRKSKLALAAILAFAFLMIMPMIFSPYQTQGIGRILTVSPDQHQYADFRPLLVRAQGLFIFPLYLALSILEYTGIRFSRID